MKDIILFAYNKHHGQFDKAGLPYIFHVHHVVRDVAWRGKDYEIVAWCHDLIEDTDTTYDDLRKLGLSPNLIQSINCLTHRKNEEYFNYIDRVLLDEISVFVKIADLNHNKDLKRLESPTEKDYQRRDKYINAINSIKTKYTGKIY